MHIRTPIHFRLWTLDIQICAVYWERNHCDVVCTSMLRTECWWLNLPECNSRTSQRSIKSSNVDFTMKLFTFRASWRYWEQFPTNGWLNCDFTNEWSLIFILLINYSNLNSDCQLTRKIPGKWFITAERNVNNPVEMNMQSKSDTMLM